jgi:hypothetical protein
MKRYTNIKLLFFGLLFAFFAVHISAYNYVLPYPSYMPGNKLYKVSRLIDKLQNYWSWGSIAQERYHLGLSDKYLVEAKTLFEYNQYLLAVDALSRSNEQFLMVGPYIEKAQHEGKEVSVIRDTFSTAEEKHEEVLNVIEQEVPKVFVWSPEKSKPITLALHEMLDEAVAIRQKEIRQL